MVIIRENQKRPFNLNYHLLSLDLVNSIKEIHVNSEENGLVRFARLPWSAVALNLP